MFRKNFKTLLRAPKTFKKQHIGSATSVSFQGQALSVRTSALPCPSVSQAFRDDAMVVVLTAVTLSPHRLIIHIVSEHPYSQ